MQESAQPASVSPDNSERIRQFLTILTGVVLVVFLIAFTAWVIILFRAGEQLIGALGVLIGAASAFGPLFSTPFSQNRSEAMGVLIYRFAVTLILTLAVFLAIGVINPQLAQERLKQGVRTTDLPTASQNLDAAASLGADVVGGIKAEIDRLISAPVSHDHEQQIGLLAELYKTYGGGDPDWESELEEQLTNSIEEGNLVWANRVAHALAITSPDRARELIGTLNDAFVIAQASDDFYDARNYVQTISLLDVGLGDSRTRCERSVTQSNLGLYFERSPHVAAYLEQAENAYTTAIQLDDSNQYAHYLLSSMLLVHSNGESSQLERAATIARNARERYNEMAQSKCAIERGDTADLNNWYRFLLLTTEAGARLELDDARANIAPLLDEAIELAERSDQFGAARYTAEAYHYRSMLMGDEVDQATFCRIVTRAPDPDNPSQLTGEAYLANPRHVKWIEQAQAQLDANEWICLPT